MTDGSTTTTGPSTKVQRVMRASPQWGVDRSGRLYVAPRAGASGGVLRAGWTFKRALRAYLRSDRSHRWATNGRCSRCGVDMGGTHSKLACSNPSTKPVDPTREAVACPLVEALERYLDAAVCRARFVQKRGVWPNVGEALLEWDKHMLDDPLDD